MSDKLNEDIIVQNDKATAYNKSAQEINQLKDELNGKI